jgi:hypothetical protein
MFFCLTNISAKILARALEYSSCTEHLIFAHFCQMLLPLKASKIICAKDATLWLGKG